MCETCCYKAVFENPYFQSFRTPPKTASGRQCLLDRSVSGRLSGLGPMAAGNVSIAPKNSHRVSDIAGAWMTALWT